MGSNILYSLCCKSHPYQISRCAKEKEEEMCHQTPRRGPNSWSAQLYVICKDNGSYICNVQLAAGSLLYSWFVTIRVTLCTYIVEVTNIKRPVANAVSFKERLPSFLPSQHEKRWQPRIVRLYYAAHPTPPTNRVRSFYIIIGGYWVLRHRVVHVIHFHIHEPRRNGQNIFEISRQWEMVREPKKSGRLQFVKERKPSVHQLV